MALVLAIVFAASFLFLGVGYGGAGFNISQIFNGGCSSTKTTSSQGTTADQELAKYEAALKTNPNDTAALLGMANLFKSLYDQGAGTGNQYELLEAQYLEKLIAADPSQKDIYMRLANIYLSKDVSDTASAVKVLNKATTVDPNNPDIYLKLGIAQQSSNKTAAVLAYQKYLELLPSGDMADTVKQQIQSLTATTTTTAAAQASTGTTAGSSTTTAGSDTTTAASSTTTTAGSTTTTAAP